MARVNVLCPLKPVDVQFLVSARSFIPEHFPGGDGEKKKTYAHDAFINLFRFETPEKDA